MAEKEYPEKFPIDKMKDTFESGELRG
jgi:hypothetical protein